MIPGQRTGKPKLPHASENGNQTDRLIRLMVNPCNRIATI